ncbi:hypothetical protein NP233_g5983 [Leucocoprinus birnbaumii]|uniref:DUF6534 domain-containing protein n=1 Tax=Leucocoprinus birnbaumii TaxID=56174 RepID=A0AAD5VXN8_9AGAR|nr:hypothetical protein NP233_g5983 [Leucocoprinus birnbaumii]
MGINPILSCASSSSLDLLHFVLGTNIIYTFIISDSGSTPNFTVITWSLKALVATQVLVIGIANAAVSIGIIISYEVIKTTSFPVELKGKFQWTIYLGCGAIALIDIITTVTVCVVLHKNRLIVGTHDISRRSDKMLLRLISYAFATGLITTLFAIVSLALYTARPETALYISVTFSATRLYANSMMAMLNVRRHLRSRLFDDSNTSAEVLTNGAMFQAGISFSPLATGHSVEYAEQLSDIMRFGGHLAGNPGRQDLSNAEVTENDVADYDVHQIPIVDSYLSMKSMLLVRHTTQADWLVLAQMQSKSSRASDRRFSL